MRTQGLLSGEKEASNKLCTCCSPCRHGESEYNVQERIGGDPALTQRGRNYASMLGAIVNEMGEVAAALLDYATARL